MNLSLYAVAFICSDEPLLCMVLKHLYKNAIFLNSHFLFLCVSLYVGQPLIFFFMLNQSLVCEDIATQ